MDLDSFQKAWQSQSSQTRVTVDADLLRKEVQRSEQNFRLTILRRDFREIAVSLVMLPLWFYLGHRNASPWTWWLGIPAITWICVFFLVDRIRHKQSTGETGEALLDCVNSSLTQVEHQIWLLRNVFWWYLLPCMIALLAFFGQVAWRSSTSILEFLCTLGSSALFLLVVYGFVYWLNQRAVRRTLVPRREELLSLRASLGEETAGEQNATQGVGEIRNPGIVRQTMLVTILTAVAVAAMFLADSLFQSQIVPILKGSRGTPPEFAKLIADQREEKNLIGLGALVMVDGKVVASAVNGERKWASGVSVELGDEWHLGGIATSVTATMIARLVESGQLQWSTTIGECFSDASIDEGWKTVTFRELLTHTAGAPPLPPDEVRQQQPPLGPEATRARREVVLKMLANKPDNPPGTKYVYSNVDYTIAGAMAEAKTGVTWEKLVEREVYGPLGLHSAGFGPPTSPDRLLPQPRGHVPYLGGKLPVGDSDDNTMIIAPAASVHMTLADLASFANEHMRGERGEGKLLSAETYKLLHTPRLKNYAYGWIMKEPTEKIPYRLYYHNGANTMWYAMVVFIPDKNMVVAVASNDGDLTSGEEAAWEIVKESVERFGEDAESARGKN
jgi:CubicO group peptidase (beta-lactamase class C family)